MRDDFVLADGWKFNLLRIVNKFLGRIGVNAVPAVWSWQTWDKQYEDLVRNLQPELAFDVGANTGQWFNAFRQIAPDCEVWSYECDPRALETLRNMSGRETLTAEWKVIPYALSSIDGESDFFQWPLESGQSSLQGLDKLGPHFKTVAQTPIERRRVIVRRLDGLVERAQIEGRRTWLKIDVQGSEMDVLIGCGDLLHAFEVIEVELSLCDFYERNTFIEEVISFLRDHGFTPLTVQTPRWGGGNGLVTGGLDADVLFVRNELVGARGRL